MSKSLNQIYLPVFGGIALTAAVAVTVANRDFAKSEIETLEDRVAQVTAHEVTARETAKVASARAAELEAKIEEVQAAASERAAMPANMTAPAPQNDVPFGIGRVALAEELAAWDVDVLPDGRGLPEGKGDVWTGEEVFVDRCASCHGDFAEGVDNWPVLAGGFDTLADEDPVKTVGSYWPHLSTAWDYISRSMPFGEAGTLTADETYAIVAYILYSNDLVDDDFELNHENFADFNMYNMEGFVIDDRPNLEYAKWRAEPCMQYCKEAVDVTMRSVFLVETPPEGGSNSVMNQATVEGLPSFTSEGADFVPVAAPQPEKEAGATAAPEASDANDANTDLAAAGKKVFKKCAACHQVGDGAKNKTGPVLNGIMGRQFGSVEGFKYSKVFQAAAEEGRVWDDAEMAAFLGKPKTHMKGTKMSFSGLKKESDQAAIIAYLASFGE